MESIWNDRRSIQLSRILVIFFAGALLALDLLAAVFLFGQSAAEFLSRFLPRQKVVCFALCVFLCSVPGFLLLHRMNALLTNLLSGRVFTPENVRLLRTVSYCCFAAGLVCLVAAVWLRSLMVVTVAAGFVGLIVRIVKNVFEQAISMKDELDFTV